MAKRELDAKEWREDTAEPQDRGEDDRSETRLRAKEGIQALGLGEETGGPDEQEIDLDDGETPFETFDPDLYEMIHVVTSPRRGARVPPPPTREEIDLEALVRDVGGASMPLLPVDLTSVPREPEPQSRPQWRVAIMIATTAIVAGSVSALTMLVLSGPPSYDPPSPPPVPIEYTGARALVAATVEAARVNEGSPETVARAEAQLPLDQAEAPPPAEAHSPAPRPPASTVRSGRRRTAAHSVRERPSPAPAPGAETEIRLAQTASEVTASPGEAGAADPTAEASAAPPAPLPEQPTRAHVDAAVRAILPALRTCGQGMDLVTLELHFASNGHATTGQVEARHLSPTQRSCIARAARAARVPPFTAPHLSVRYPVRL